MSEIPLVTPRSIRDAQLAQAIERAQFTRETGWQVAADGSLVKPPVVLVREAR